MAECFLYFSSKVRPLYGYVSLYRSYDVTTVIIITLSHLEIRINKFVFVVNFLALVYTKNEIDIYLEVGEQKTQKIQLQKTYL